MLYSMKNFPGRKWLNDATYLTPEFRARVEAAVAECRDLFPGERVIVRPASYIGDPSPLAVVCYGAGQRIFRSVYR